MKRFALVLLIILSCFFAQEAHSQDYEANWGKIYDKSGLLSMHYLIGIEDDAYYVLEKPKKSPTLLKFSLDHKLLKRTQPKMQFQGKRVILDRFVKTQSGTFGYLQQFDKKKKTYKIFTSKFEDGKFAAMREIYSHQYKKLVSVFSTQFSHPGHPQLGSRFIVSKNKEYAAYTNALSSKPKSRKESFAVALFDQDLNMLWESYPKIPEQQDDLTLIQTKVSDEGIIYLLGRFEGGKKINGTKIRKEYIVFKITENGMDNFLLELPANTAATHAAIHLPSDQKNELVLSGLYQSSESKRYYDGAFSLTVNTETGKKDVKLSKFEDEFDLKKIMKKKMVEGQIISLNSTFELSNGHFGFVAEAMGQQSNTPATSGPNPGGLNSGNKIKLKSGNLFCVFFDENGNFLKETVIEKFCHDYSSTILSYAAAVMDDKLFLVFNDMKTGKKKREADTAGGKKKSVMSSDLVVLDSQGEIEFNETIFDKKSVGLLFTPYMMDYTDKFILLTSQNGSLQKFAFGTIQVKE